MRYRIIFHILMTVQFCWANNLDNEFVSRNGHPILASVLDDILGSEEIDTLAEALFVRYGEKYYDISPSRDETSLQIISSSLSGQFISYATGSAKILCRTYKGTLVIIDKESASMLDMELLFPVEQTLIHKYGESNVANIMGKTWEYIFKNGKLFKKELNSETMPLPGENYVRYYPARSTECITEKVVYDCDVLDVQPHFPGGENAKLKCLTDTLSKNKLNVMISGSVIIPVEIIISKAGYVVLTEKSDSVIKSYSRYKNRIYDILKKMPKWEAGIINGKRVDTRYYLNFKLDIE